MTDPWFAGHEFEGERVAEFARRWPSLPDFVRVALIAARELEEEGAYKPTLLSSPVRGFFRQLGGAAAVRQGEDAATTDPRNPGGAISGPGGPYDENAVVIDTRNAVILEACEVAVVGGIRKGILDPKPISALVLRGRINKTTERVQALYLLNEDGAAGIVTELIGVASRAGWRQEFMDRIKERMDAMPL